MLRWIGVALCLAFPACSDAPEQGGEWVENADAPFVITITDATGRCTGAKVGPRVFVTARHCAFGVGPLQLSHANGENAVTVTAADFVTAPEDSSMTAYDLAFFVVDRDTPTFAVAPFRVTPRAFPRPVKGFGFGCDGAKLRRFTLTTIPDDSFAQLYPQLVDGAATAPIARFDGPDGICDGDSGGPLVDDAGVVLGVVSRVRGFTGDDARIVVAAKTNAAMAALLRATRADRAHPGWRDLALVD